MRAVRYLTLEEVVQGATIILANSDLRDVGLLDAAVGRPAATAFGQDAYPTLPEKAAALLHSIVSSHPFVDGNKRMGWAAARAFLELNGATLHHTENDAYELVIAVASGAITEVSKIAERLAEFIEMDV